VTRHMQPEKPIGTGTQDTTPAGSSPKLAARRKREAEALRANLRKRKDQARAREQPKQE
jgi:hypothetical protein